MPSVSPSVNGGLWVTSMCQCRFLSFNKSTTPVGAADNGGSCACVGVGVYGKSLLSSQCCCESKTTLKKLSFKKKYKITSLQKMKA